MISDAIKNSRQVIETDLLYICGCLKDEFAGLSGKRVLMTGGAGFLGHYLIQSLLYWNKNHDKADAVELTVFDNCLLGIPKWLKRLEGTKNLFLRVHNI